MASPSGRCANCWGEFKWEKVNPAYLEAYRDLLALALVLPDVRFTSMVVSELLTPAKMARYKAIGGGREAYLKFMRLPLLRQAADRPACIPLQ